MSVLGNYVTSAIRTGVPGAVGWLLSWLVALQVSVPPAVEQWLIGLLTFVLLLAYYLLVRALESKWPALGWLLGTPAKPTYAAAPKAKVARKSTRKRKNS